MPCRESPRLVNQNIRCTSEVTLSLIYMKQLSLYSVYNQWSSCASYPSTWPSGHIHALSAPLYSILLHSSFWGNQSVAQSNPPLLHLASRLFLFSFLQLVLRGSSIVHDILVGRCLVRSVCVTLRRWVTVGGKGRALEVAVVGKLAFDPKPALSILPV